MLSKLYYRPNRAKLEHNLTQQIYVSEQCWAIVLTAKRNNTNDSIGS
jgi:hypothetical protein